MNQEGGKARVQSLYNQFGCLPTIGEMSTVDRFKADELAAGIESQLAVATDYGFTKITLHMDLPDAAALAKHLRKKVK